MFGLDSIKKALTGRLLIAFSVVTFASCNYLDIVPPETPDFDDTMKDRDATLGFLYSCYTGIPSIYFDCFCRYYDASD